MELVGIEFSQLTWLARLQRPSGPPYIPDVIEALQRRYSFARVPSPADAVLAKEIILEGGKYRDHAIGKVGIYSDGVVISTTINSKILDDFWNDALEFVKSDFGVVEDVKPQVQYDSHVVVRGNFDPQEWLSPAALAIRKELGELVSQYGTRASFDASGFTLQASSAVVKGISVSGFAIERRVGEPIEKKLFYSTAPLRTDDHLALLARLESD